MKAVYTADQVRAAERATGEALASGRLMARAAAGLAREVAAELADAGRRVRGARVLLVAGPGDNGGDGLFAAARLAQRGARVTVWAAFEKRHGQGWAALLAAGGRAVDAAGALAALESADVVIDAVFGIGARPGLPDAVAAFAAACAERGVAVVAADLPSGLEADACRPAGPAFAAARTVSFGAWKPCHVLQPARDRCGARRLIDLGLFAEVQATGSGRPKFARQATVSGPVAVARRARSVATAPDPLAPPDPLAWRAEATESGTVATERAEAMGSGTVAAERAEARGSGTVATERALRTISSGPDTVAAVAVTPPYLSELELSDLASRWPRPTSTSDKYSRGVVAIDTGSAAYPGAAVLGALGAVYSGAGYVKYVGPARAEVRAALPNVVCPSADSPLPRADAWLLGSGWGDRPDAATHVAAILAQGRPTVVDAEAIQCVTSATPAPVLLTPHSGELARLLGVPRDAVAADPVAAVQAACRRTGATILLKGATQYVATPGDAVTYLCFPGPAWTAQAGSGDVLAGIAATLLAAGLPPRDAALLAGSIQALTAARHPGPYPPQDLARFLPSAIASL